MHFMQFSDGSKFIGKYINFSNEDEFKMGHDITINANPVVTTYPISYNPEWIEIEVYL